MQKEISILVFISIILMSSPVAVFAAGDDIVQSWRATSERENYQAVTGPVAGRVVIGEFQQWELKLLDAAGKPVYPARISIGGGMPGHGHGLPTSPQVTKYLGDGRWLVEGLKLNMAGEWLLVFGVQAEKGADRVDFTFNVDF